MYAEYLKERESVTLLEFNYGLATYSVITKQEIYVQDVYIKPEFRSQKLAHKLTDECISHYENNSKEKVKAIYGSVDIQANGTESSMKTILSYGFKINNIENNKMIYFKKEIK